MSNTSQNPFENNDFENMLTAFVPHGIEAQEAAGQAKFNRYDVMPLETNNGKPAIDGYSALGFEIGKPVDA